MSGQPGLNENAGRYLHRLRVERNLDLESVAEATKISISNLRAMEAQDFKNLPADTFTRGLLAIYAEFLGQDPKTITERFMTERDREYPEHRHKRLRFKQNLTTNHKLAEPAHISSALVATIMLVVMAGLFAAFCLYNSWNPFASLMQGKETEQQDMASPFEQNGTMGGNAGMPENPASTVTSAGQAAVEDQDRPQGIPYRLNLHFTADSRFSITLDDQAVQEFSVTRGEEHSFEAGKQIHITFFDPDSAAITLNAIPVIFPKSENGQITLRIPEDLLEKQ